MKKTTSILFIFIIFCFFLYGCENKINDENGNVKQFQVENSYVDGNYFIFSQKYDDDSKAAYMSLSVKNNIIVKVDFNYIYRDDKLYIDKDNKEDETTYYVSTLNTLVLQNQDTIKNPNETYEELFEDYKILLSEGLKIAKTGNIKISYVNIDYTYTAKITEFDQKGYDARMTVTFENGVIEEILYSKADSNGNLITSDNLFLNEFKIKYNETYQKYIQDLSNLSIGRENLVLSTNNLELDKEYNQLARTINEKTEYFDYTKHKLFKNIGDTM